MASSSVENLEMHKKGPNISSQRHLAPLGKLVTMGRGIKQLFNDDPLASCLQLMVPLSSLASLAYLKVKYTK